MYDRDTFFQLSLPGQVGLALLSLGLAFIFIWMAHPAYKTILPFSTSIGMALRFVIALFLFWLFLWLSPQVYYLYYQTIIENLPWQNVISYPPSVRELGQVLFLQNTHSLSDHSKAILGWALILNAIINTLRIRV